MTETLPLFVRDPVKVTREPKFGIVDKKFFNYWAEKVQVGRVFGSLNEDYDKDPKYAWYHYITVCDKEFRFSDDNGWGGSKYNKSGTFNTVLQLIDELRQPRNDVTHEIKQWLEDNYEEIVYSVRYWNYRSYLLDLERARVRLKEVQNEVRFREIWSNVIALETINCKDFDVAERKATGLEFGMLESEYQKYVLQR